ncbi:class I SAM-dependent methyltransferase [Ensifer sp. YR511]|uniref:class I SAM-dependent methyltransferase n=1 Tax=Ensifer sp. YR511 TaxID=1855294 RepID=UPI00087ECCFA|nr:class I SAM-dependent methyltransferase [Ensifer sp. YR511]SDO22001.1 Methyltransferase domain-containing protein [Ensifer sp. YR511]
MLFNNLKSLVRKNSLLWGADVAEAYHGAAARDMQLHWDQFIEPARQRHPINYDTTIDFACGYGRNTDFLLSFARHITMIDVNQHNLDYCRKKYADNVRVDVKECSGYDLRDIVDDYCSFFYTFDSMVHFPPRIIKAYLPEFFRILKSGGYALIHHSNFTGRGVDADFRASPHWRNYMSAKMFAEVAEGAGFAVVEQTIHAWGGVPELDCVSILKKP